MKITNKDIEKLSRIEQLEYKFEHYKLFDYSSLTLQFTYQLFFPVALFSLIVLTSKLDSLYHLSHELLIISIVALIIGVIYDLFMLVCTSIRKDRLDNKYFKIVKA